VRLKRSFRNWLVVLRRLVMAAFFGSAVGLAVLLRVSDGPFGLGLHSNQEQAAAIVQCTIDRGNDPSHSLVDFHNCLDEVARDYPVAAPQPWYEAHPLLAAFGAGLVTFVVLAFGERLLVG
jgi:hypothetical protein